MKKLFALLLTLALCLSVCACTAAPEATEAPNTGSTLTFTVTVVHADGASKEFTYETDQTYLGPVLVAEGLIKGNDGPYGLEITEVDGEAAVFATDSAYWAIYEGDEYAMTGIDEIKLTDGGSYKLEYTRG